MFYLSLRQGKHVEVVPRADELYKNRTNLPQADFDFCVVALSLQRKTYKKAWKQFDYFGQVVETSDDVNNKKCFRTIVIRTITQRYIINRPFQLTYVHRTFFSPMHHSTHPVGLWPLRVNSRENSRTSSLIGLLTWRPRSFHAIQ